MKNSLYLLTIFVIFIMNSSCNPKIPRVNDEGDSHSTLEATELGQNPDREQDKAWDKMQEKVEPKPIQKQGQ